MNWDQIEHKWAAMTHRIRADYAANQIEPTVGTMQGVKAGDALSATIADSQGEAAKDTETNTHPK